MMFALRVVQAAFGDCLLLEFGTKAEPKFILIDGGPDEIYKRHLRHELAALGQAGHRLELVVLSHVDEDHAIGLLDFFTELDEQRVNGLPPLIAVEGVWHNSFRAIDPDNTIQPRLASVMSAAGDAARTMSAANAAVLGIEEGSELRRFVRVRLKLPLNDGFQNGLVCVDDHPAPWERENLKLTIVGPTRANLDELRSDWEEWLEAHADEIEAEDPLLRANADQSVPNLSSIMVLAEADGKTMLLTGDGRSDHLLQGLQAAGLLDAEGSLHVDLMKVAHHGSDRNATKRFFRKVTADTYVFSANGKDNNPDLATLIWIVESAKDANRKIKLVFTNGTTSTRKIQDEYDPDEFGYKTKTLPKKKHSLRLTLAP